MGGTMSSQDGDMQPPQPAIADTSSGHWKSEASVSSSSSRGYHQFPKKAREPCCVFGAPGKGGLAFEASSYRRVEALAPHRDSLSLLQLRSWPRAPLLSALEILQTNASVSVTQIGVPCDV